VLVSSHLMSEMALTADHLVVIGRGRLIADDSVQRIIERGARGHVLVRASDIARLAGLLERAGAGVRPEAGTDGGVPERSVDERGVPERGLLVTGLDAARIGAIAAAGGIVLHELATQRASLEAAYMDLTRESVEFRTESAAEHDGGAQS